MKLIKLSDNLSFNPERMAFVKSGKYAQREYVAIYFGGGEADDELTIHEIPAFIKWYEEHLDMSYAE